MEPPKGARITYQQQYRTCGKTTCRCRTTGPKHGPYEYGYFRRDGKLQSFYVGKVQPDGEQKAEHTHQQHQPDQHEKAK